MFSPPVKVPKAQAPSHSGMFWRPSERSFHLDEQGKSTSPSTTRSASWEFSRISILSPDGMYRPKASSPPVVSAAQPNPVVRPLDNPLEYKGSRLGDRVTLADNGDAEPEALKKSMDEAAPADGQRMVAAGPRPVSLSMLRHVADRSGTFVSGPPVGKDLGAIEAIGGAGTLGWTFFPSAFKAPDFEFNTRMGAGAGAASGLNWTCDPTLKTSASEGTADSFYTSAAKYDSGRKEGGKDVFYNFSPTTSSLIQAGEQEHCDDHAEAYKISLQEAESVVKDNVVGKSFGPAASESDAEKLVLKAIDDKLTHKALGTDKTKWAGIYRTLFKKTAMRDTSKWHSLSKGARTETATDVTYEIVQGASQVGSHSPSSIIKY
jgi:hypothetical protein